MVAIDTWVKAGYFHEPDEVAGMAHLFEHMFFKGSKKFPGAEEISQELAAVGGDSNAGTIYDSTNYYFVVPRAGFARALDIMADAVANPLFDAGELDRESEVVIEESNRKLDNPPALTHRAHAGGAIHRAPHQALAHRLERGAAQHRPRRPARLLPHALPAAEHDRCRWPATSPSWRPRRR